MLKKLYRNYILKYHKLLIPVLLILGVCVFIFLYSNNQTDVVKNNDMIKKSDTLVENNVEIKKEEKDIKRYYVDIKGAVTTPSVYQVEENARVIDVIKLAGGFTKEADQSVINLSKKVTDEMVIIVYTKKELDNFKKDSLSKQEIIKYIEGDCKCPDPIINNACINNNQGTTSSKLNINKSSKEELMTLPGIGEAKALDIIDHRTNVGAFKTLDELKDVKGIGESVFDKIKDYITL